MPEMMTLAPVGARVRAARVAAGLNQEALAVVAGISRATIERVENERGRVRRTTIEAIAAALGRTASDLYRADA